MRSEGNLSYRLTSKGKSGTRRKRRKATKKKKTATKRKKPATKKRKTTAKKSGAANKKKKPAAKKKKSAAKKKKSAPKKKSTSKKKETSGKKAKGDKKKATTTPAGYHFQWQYSERGWKDYDIDASDLVEAAYQGYLSNPGMCDVRAVKSGQWQYQVDFVNMKQTNIQHEGHTTRNIRRVPFS